MTAHPELDAQDFLSPALQSCPFPFYAALREAAPVYREPKTGIYIVSRYDLLVEVVRDPVRFSNDVDLARSETTPARMPPEALAIMAAGYPRPTTLQRTDPPRHGRYRRIVNRAFTAARVKAMAPYIEGVIDDLIAGFGQDREIDFVSRFAVPLPCIVIADQIGVAREDISKVKQWTDALLDPVGMMADDARKIECARQVVEFQTYFAARIEERRAAPKDDILQDLISEMGDDEAPLSTAEVLNLLEQLLTGGNETTTNTLSSGLLLLLRNPDQMARLRADPSLVPTFVEEVLRLETPVQGLFRRATGDVELGGVDIPRDAVVMVRYAAANRDERRFACPEALDVDRADPHGHIAFGSGVHICPGRLLARQELLSAYTRLFERFEGVELAQDAFDYHPSFFLRGLKSLKVRLTPRLHA